MSPIAIIVICLVFYLLGRFISPTKRHTQHFREYRNPYLPHYLPQEAEEERNRHAFNYTVAFVVLLCVAMYLAHDLLQSEVVVALK